MIDIILAFIVLLITLIISLVSKIFIKSRPNQVMYFAGQDIQSNLIENSMLNANICTSYVSALDDIPKFVKPNNQKGFNMSMLKYGNDFIFAVRFYNTVEGLITNKIIPGNTMDTRYPTRKIGKNFIWGTWLKKGVVDATVYFKGKLNLDSCDVEDVSDIKFIYNVDSFLDKHTGCQLSLADMRLSEIDGKIFTHDGAISIIKEINLNNEIMEKIGYYNTKICKQTANDGYDKKYDKNWALWKTSGDKFTFFHWFEKDGVYIVDVPKNYNLGCTKHKYVGFSKDPIPPLGNSILPMFSFTTPFIKTKIGYLSAGHTKLMCTGRYEPNSSANKIRIKIRTEFPKLGNYIEHSSYIYFAFFILLKDDKFLFSNSFLPVKVIDGYVFSIIFPMSLVEVDTSVLLSGGIGDWANIIMKFDVEKVAASCIHDAEKFAANDYQYELLTI